MISLVTTIALLSLSDADSMGDFSNEGEDWVIQMNESSWTTLSDRRIDLAIQSMYVLVACSASTKNPRYPNAI